MVDSDDTDLLLLIPPNFFFVNTSRSTKSDSSTDTVPLSNCNCSMAFNSNLPNYDYYSSQDHIPRERNEFTYNDFNAINHRILSLSKNIHSTPKIEQPLLENVTPSSKTSPGFLKEIDNFLGDKPNNSIIDIHNLSLSNDLEKSLNIQPLTRRSLEKHNKMYCDKTEAEPKNYDNTDIKSNGKLEDEPLLSLCDIWDEQKQSNDKLTLHEERLRRMHCEKSIQVLQLRLLEYQQKITVAIEVDKRKDNTLKKYLELNQKLSHQTTQYDAINSDLTSKLNKYESLERNYNDALETITKLQDSNKILEMKCENMSVSSKEIKEIHKQQIRELEVRLSNSIENEKLSNDQMANLKEELYKLHSKYEYEKNLNSTCKFDIKKLNEEIIHLKAQKADLIEKYQNFHSEHDAELKNQETEIKDLKQTIGIYSEKEVENLIELYIEHIKLSNIFLSIRKISIGILKLKKYH